MLRCLATSALLALLLVACGSPPAASQPSTEPDAPASSKPTPAGSIMSSAEFQSHADGYISSFTAAFEHLVAATKAGDEPEQARLADSIYDSASRDLEWQRLHADRILGQCYDDAAAHFSNAVTYVTYSMNTLRNYLESGDQLEFEVHTGWLRDIASEVREYELAIERASC